MEEMHGDMMNQKSGIYLVNKPKGITSNDLVQKIKRKFGYKKVGHAGTLDPLATGLMVILVNQATKISNYVLENDKSYNVVIKMFTQTDSFDITGKVIEEMEPVKLSKTLLKETVEFQYPPIYSAIKVNGKKLYEYARQNKEVKIEPRIITINHCKLVNYDAKNNEIVLDIDCSKGTYIRSFVNDFMHKMNLIGTVKELQRTKMQIVDINLTENKPFLDEKTIACIGFFDGIHKVHEKILRKAANIAKRKKLKLVVITFDKKIRDYLQHKNTAIQKNRLKYALIDRLVAPSFIFEIQVSTKVTKVSSAFFMSYIKNVLNVQRIVVGNDFRFGEKASGNINDLKNFFGARNVTVFRRRKKYSSSRIKELLQAKQYRQVKKITNNLNIDE
jgi:tRNA pseudouridine55 synthase